MEDKKGELAQRKIYYDHEPAYQRLARKGEKGWKTQGQVAPFSWYGNFFKATGLLPRPPQRVLDFGCGGGEFSLLLARQGYRVVGTDFSRTAIKMAKANAKAAKLTNARFSAQDALRPTLKPGTFGIVFSVNVLHCLIGRDRRTYLVNARKLLKPGGVLALSSMVDFPKDQKTLRYLKINRQTRTDQNRTRCFESEKKILAEVKAAGLKVIFHARLEEKDCDSLFVIARKSE